MSKNHYISRLRIHILLHQISNTVKFRSRVFIIQYPQDVEATFIAFKHNMCKIEERTRKTERRKSFQGKAIFGDYLCEFPSSLSISII